jgi:hypothetical protein
VEEAKRIYGILGAPEKIAWAVGPGGHGMPPVVRESIYGWMNRWLRDGPAGPAPEPRFQTEYEQDLYATATGQVSTSLGGETASSENIRRFGKVAPPRGRLSTALPAKIIQVTRFERTRGAVTLQKDGSGMWLGFPDGRRLFARLLEPDTARSRKKTLLYLDERGAGHAGSDAAELAKMGYTVLALDLAGMGATAPRWASYSDPWFGSDKTTWLALMVGKPLVGIRMDDIVRALDLLQERGLLFDGHAMAFASGAGTVPLLHAAVIEPRISHVFLEGGLISYAAIARSPVHRRIFESILLGVLGKYDLPDLAAALPPRPLVLVDMRTPLGNVAPLAEVQDAYGDAKRAYAAAGASFRIGLHREEEPLESAYPELR